MSGGTSLFQSSDLQPTGPAASRRSLFGHARHRDPAPEPGTILFLNTRHLFGRDFDPRYHAIIKNVKTDASDPGSS